MEVSSLLLFALMLKPVSSFCGNEVKKKTQQLVWLAFTKP